MTTRGDTRRRDAWAPLVNGRDWRLAIGNKQIIASIFLLDCGAGMIIIVMGVSGSGKTSVAGLIAKRLDCGFSDADTFHTAANKAKMAAGNALTDEDRWPWLDAMRGAILSHRAAGQTHVFACSALKRIYRERLQKGDQDVVFVYLSGSFDLLESRLAQRANHFFNPALLKSQVDTLEAPTPDEGAITIDITPSVEEIVDQALAALAARTA